MLGIWFHFSTFPDLCLGFGLVCTKIRKTNFCTYRPIGGGKSGITGKMELLDRSVSQQKPCHVRKSGKVEILGQKRVSMSWGYHIPLLRYGKKNSYMKNNCVVQKYFSNLFNELIKNK